jgi:hypothetical protein
MALSTSSTTSHTTTTTASTSCSRPCHERSRRGVMCVGYAGRVLRERRSSRGRGARPRAARRPARSRGATRDMSGSGHSTGPEASSSSGLHQWCQRRLAQRSKPATSWRATGTGSVTLSSRAGCGAPPLHARPAPCGTPRSGPPSGRPRSLTIGLPLDGRADGWDLRPGQGGRTPLRPANGPDRT